MTHEMHQQVLLTNVYCIPTLYNARVKMADRRPNLALHGPFCGSRHVSFVLALGLTSDNHWSNRVAFIITS